jgi:hypothetical protein
MPLPEAESFSDSSRYRATDCASSNSDSGEKPAYTRDLSLNLCYTSLEVLEMLGSASILLVKFGREVVNFFHHMTKPLKEDSHSNLGSRLGYSLRGSCTGRSVNRNEPRLLY